MIMADVLLNSGEKAWAIVMPNFTTPIGTLMLTAGPIVLAVVHDPDA
jgi:hypothetical protein